MRRALLTILLVAAAGALAVFATGASDDDGAGKKYYVELDNAFGLIEGADVKVAGVRAGKIKSMELDTDRFYAKIGIEITQGGFDDLRKDVFCETRPQSLIGEYFIDCKPGKSAERLPDGATIPVDRTGTTIPPDLVNNIMRRPYRERFSIILSELGAALAARGGDLNETIRRANPALRETDRVLRILAEQRTIIRNLYDDADKVVARLADSREDVGRFVEEARDTASTVATRDDELRRQYQTFPTFLRELRPTLARLGEAVDEQYPALVELNRNADLLRRFFGTLGPFAEASRPAVRTLAGAARAGRPAIRAALPNIALLRNAVDALPETANNLAITLEHLDDPKFATEKDARAGRGPDGGFTGLEALIRYFYAQSQAINLFDANSYTLKANIFLDRECANYADVAAVKAQTPAVASKCRAWLGNNQPGITSTDFTKTGGGAQTRSKKDGDDKDKSDEAGDTPTGLGPEAPRSGGGSDGGDKPAQPGNDLPGSVGDVLQQLLPQGLPAAPALPETPAAPAVPKVDGGSVTKDDKDLLDFLLAP